MSKLIKTILAAILFLLPLAMIKPAYAGDGGKAAPQVGVAITHIKAFVLQYGVNAVAFWGLGQIAIPHSHPLKLKTTLIRQPALIIRYDDGNGLTNRTDSYLAITTGVSKADGIMLIGDKGPIGDTFTNIAYIGQGSSSAVRFFNGLMDGHCQTFAIAAAADEDEETGRTKTTISLFELSFGLHIENHFEYGASFRLLKQYTDVGSNNDPVIVISQDFYLPLPAGYEARADMPLPAINRDNTYLNPTTAGDSC